MPIPSGNLVTPVGQREDGTLRSLLIDDKDRIHTVDSLNAFSESLVEEVSDFTAPAGSNVLSGTAVPSGEVWHVLNVAAIDAVSSYSRVTIWADISSINVILLDRSTPVGNRWDIWNGEIVLSEGDKIEVGYSGVTLNDTILFRYGGYKTTLVT